MKALVERHAQDTTTAAVLIPLLMLRALSELVDKTAVIVI